MISHRPAPPRPGRAASHRGQRGAQLLEAALALPIFLTVLLGFVDLSLAVLQTSQVTSAAADRARTAIVRWDDADVAGSANRAAVEASIKARLPGQSVEAIDVACLHPTGTAVACTDADPSLDRVRVKVTWRYRPISPVGLAMPTKTLTGTATMGLIDQPASPTSTTVPASTTTTTVPSATTTTTTTAQSTTTTAPTTCVLSSLSASPSSVQRKSNGSLVSGYTLTAVTNGAANCSALKVNVVTNGSTTTTYALNQQSSMVWSAFVSKTSATYTAGVKTGSVVSGTTTIGSAAFLTVTS